jgi:hypothetical protein
LDFLFQELTMNLPSRFRPCLEALEERALLSVSVSYTALLGRTGELLIDARQSNADNHITVINHGNGHITGSIAGDPDGAGDFNGGAGFFNVSVILIYGGPGGATVNYAQQGEASNPSGDQVYGRGLFLQTQFAGGENTFYATLASHAVRAGALSFAVYGGGGDDAVAIEANSVDIAAGAKLSATVNDTSAPGNGRTDFSMDWSGVKRGLLQVYGQSGNDAAADFGLFATFEGASPLRSLAGRGAFGAAPGDLAFAGGTGNNDLVMLLHSPGGLPLTGDLYGGSGENFGQQTANVKVHGFFSQDFIEP